MFIFFPISGHIFFKTNFFSIKTHKQTSGIMITSTKMMEIIDSNLRTTATTETHSIFLLNPLTVYFLSGYAFQLFVLSCDHDSQSLDLQNRRKEYESFNTRMSRWIGVFEKHCLHLFHSHTDIFEINSTNTHHSPHELHSQLIMWATETMLTAVELKNVNDKVTLLKIKAWVKLIESILPYPLMSIFDNKKKRQKMRTLFARLRELCNDGINAANVDHHQPTNFPHFSPEALFIRFAFIVFIHRNKYDKSKYEHWESATSAFLSKHLSIDGYLVPNKSELANFGPVFPYTHRLPCSIFYKSWKQQDQDHSPASIYVIFQHVLRYIYGVMATYDNLNDNHECETVNAFYCIMNAAFDLMVVEKKLVQNCDKQRRHCRKRRKLESESKTQTTPLSRKTWLFSFLFSNKYYPSYQSDSFLNSGCHNYCNAN